MIRVQTLLGASVLGFAGLAHGQSASVALSGPTSAAPGETVSISIVVDFNTGGAGAGVFGAAGLYGFGGDAAVNGDASASSSSVNAMLSFGATASEPNGGSSVRAAGGRGFDGGIASGPFTVATFDVTMNGDASGDVTIGYDGAVVLVEDNALVTYSTSPGVNQSSLSVTPLTITIGSSRLCADQNEDGNLTGADFNAFLTNFSNGDAKADVNGDGSLTGADFNGWLTAFSAGLGGPTCSP